MNEKNLKQKARENFKKKPLGYESKYEIDIYTDGYVEGATETTKELQAKIKDLEWQLKQVLEDNDYYQKQNAELEAQIADLKDYVLKVSKFLHNNSNVRPDYLVYKERDKLLIKELKLVEKWELSK